ncbi:MAG: heme o synthase [Planctomycetia bacterium]|nr:heme o synthase [Planctomycetia bacterium]
MSMTSIGVPQTATGPTDVLRVARDYLELAKPKIAVLELVTVATAFYLAGHGSPQLPMLLHALIGTALVATSASAFNQWLERGSDALMPRTADRPLPAGRLGSRDVAWFGSITAVIGVCYLALAVNQVTACLGLLSWFLYVVVYTPLKRRSATNTAVGAVAGALPVLMGWTATGRAVDVNAATLFMIVFLWQFPHFMAIAWLYRRDYALGGMQMLTVVDPTGQRAGRQAVLAASVLVPVTLVPVLVSFATPIYGVAALTIGIAQLVCAVQFFRKLDETSARRLLRASLLYLPAILGLLTLVPLI